MYQSLHINIYVNADIDTKERLSIVVFLLSLAANRVCWSVAHPILGVSRTSLPVSLIKLLNLHDEAT